MSRSEEWFAAVEALGPPPTGNGPDPGPINLVVSRAEGDAVADGVGFERAGLPAAVICSDAFGATADAMATLRGAPGYRYLTTPHPVAVLTPDQVRERAAQLAGAVADVLTGGGS